MRLICARCGNFTHFEADVETVRIVIQSPQGLLVRDQDDEGVFDAGGWIRLGLNELVSFTEGDDQSVLRRSTANGQYENDTITCARCGSRRVSVPYRRWSPPRKEQFLEEEIISNRQEYAWLRKEHEIHEHSLPVVQ
ncbi:hypothetical protein ACFL4U_04250 [Candidatus Neomarinimicrobiota bacterium]